MKKLFLISLLFIAFGAFAQQGLQIEFAKQDSVQMKLQRQMEYFQLISGLSGFLDEEIKLSDINYQDEFMKRYTLNLKLFPTNNNNWSGVSSGMTNSFYSPFYRNTKILSTAAYQLSDKFTLGGFSYGANNIFSAPYPNKGINNFDSYGSTLFMQYKVSKNFKIETRVNVLQGGQHPGF